MPFAWERTRRRSSLLPGLGGSNSLIYLFRDEFTTPVGAPIGSPHTSEPGPGTLTITDTGNYLSIAGGKLVFGGTIVATGNPRAVVTNSLARVIGRTFFFQINFSALGGQYLGGWSNALAPSNLWGFDLNKFGALSILYNSGTSIGSISQTLSTNTDYIIAVQLLSDGTRLFIKGGAYTSWTLLWCDHDANTTPLFPFLEAILSSGTPLTSDFWRSRDLPAPFNTDNGLCVVNVATPVSGVVQTSVADQIVDFSFTLSGTPAAGDTYELRYNVLDANNYNTAYLKRNVGNTAYDFNMDTVVAGVPTNRINVVGVGTPDRIRVIHNGNLHDCYTAVTTTITKRGGQINNSNQATATGISANFINGTSVSLVSQARTSNSYSELDKV